MDPIIDSPRSPPLDPYSIRQALRPFCRRDQHATCSGVTVTADRAALVCVCTCHAPTAS